MIFNFETRILNIPNRPGEGARMADKSRRCTQNQLREPTVVFLEHSGLPGGGQLGLVRLLKEANPCAMSVVVIGRGNAFDALPREQVIRPWPSERLIAFPNALDHFHKYLQKVEPDVIVANSARAALYLSLIPKRDTPIRIYYARSDMDIARMSRLKHWFMSHWVLASFDAFISNSNWTQSTLPSWVSQKPNAIAYPISGTTRAPRLAKDKTGAGYPLTILSMSRIASWKGIDVLLDAIEIVNRRGHELDVQVTIAGAAHHEDKNFELAIRDRVSRTLPNVSVVGHVDDVSALLDRADVLILASTQPEPFGQVLVQGIASQLVVIATDVGGPPEVITHEQTGYLVKPNDAHAIADRIVWIIKNPEEAIKVAHRARESSARFADEVTVPELKRGIRQLVAKVNRRRSSSLLQLKDDGAHSGGTDGGS